MLRPLIRRLLRPLNYDIRRYVTECGTGVRLLDLAVAAAVTARTVPYVVQVGANDGVTDDPLRHLILKFRLPGLLIEPMPDAFEQLLANYAGQSQLRFENCALWTEDGERDFFRICHATGDNPLIKGMAGLSREVLRAASRRLPGKPPRIETIRVQTRRPESIFDKHGVTGIDLLLVDTEGLDDQIIPLILNLGMTPAIIRYEHIHLSPDRQDAFARVLTARNYRFARTRTDTLALLQDAIPSNRSTSAI